MNVLDSPRKHNPLEGLGKLLKKKGVSGPPLPARPMGISSPGAPVLKAKVAEWLTRSHWRKWVVAFTSAQCYDGGAGGSYILLRHRRLAKDPGKK